MGRYADFAPTIANKLWLYGASALLIALLWAVLVYRPLERRRVSLRALLLLVVMEATYFALIKIFRGW